MGKIGFIGGRYLEDKWREYDDSRIARDLTSLQGYPVTAANVRMYRYRNHLFRNGERLGCLGQVYNALSMMRFLSRNRVDRPPLSDGTVSEDYLEE